MGRKPPTPRGCKHVCIGGARECAEDVQAVCESWVETPPLPDDARCGCGCHYTDDGLVASGAHEGKPAPPPDAVPAWVRVLYEYLEGTTGDLREQFDAMQCWKPLNERDTFLVDNLRWFYNLLQCPTCGLWYEGEEAHSHGD